MQQESILRNTIFNLGNNIIDSINRFKFFFKYGTTDYFNDINIEINTGCNRRCEYCPNSKFERGLLKYEKFMDKRLFKKIINELSAINFAGRISPQCYGEPLLDKRVIELMSYANKKLPNVCLVMITNGDFLTIDLYNKLINAGIKKFIITQHGHKMSPNIRKLFHYLQKSEMPLG